MFFLTSFGLSVSLADMQKKLLTVREQEFWAAFRAFNRRHRRNPRQADLARIMEIDRQRVHQLWNRLVIKGYIQKGKP